MTRAQLLIGKLAEECMEVAHVAMKIQQFGMDDCYPLGGADNKRRLHDELHDLMAIINMLNEEQDLGFKPDEIRIRDKTKRVNHYAQYAQLLGHVSGPQDALDRHSP